MKYFKERTIKFTLTSLFLLLVNSAFAQSYPTTSDELLSLMIVVLTCIIALIVLFIAIYMLHILKVITRDVAIQKAQEEGTEFIEEPGWWATMMDKLTRSVPMEDEQSIELDHDYDGIKELDNHLPPWWTYLFYLTIVFSVVYMFVYHVSGSLPLQEEEYANELAIAEEQKSKDDVEDEGPMINENNVVFVDDKSALANGEKIYQSQCAACHKSKGEGGIGPNLTDEYWLHGGSMKEIFSTIKYGVPEKGMISWEPLLSPVKMRDVSSYIKTLVGTNPPNAKGPQGELYVEKEEPTEPEPNTTEPNETTE